MIPRLSPPAWPNEEHAFGRGELGRPLRILVDTATAREGEAYDCLRAFSYHPAVEIFMPDEGGRPLTIGDYNPTARLIPVEHDAGARRIRNHIWPDDALRIARASAMPGGEAEAERATIMASIATSLKVDVLATRSEFLLARSSSRLIERANPVSPEAAAALLGLFLRFNGDHSISANEGLPLWSRQFDYFVLMRELLPSAWRWFSGCNVFSRAQGDEEAGMIAQSAMERVERVLRARDRLHSELQQPSDREVIEEALFYFDVTLLMLGGAFDATARVADHIHGLSSKAVSWANDRWWAKLARVNPPLAQLMDDEQPARDARELVAVLRNTIHGQSLGTISYQGGGPRQELVVVPKSLERDFEQLVSRQPNAGAFGLGRLSSGQLYLDPGDYLEALLPRVLQALNAIMDATPVDRAPGVDSAELMTGAPAEETDDNFFHPAVRRRHRVLAGFP